jgi:phospholipid transport system substrate-binding protein
MISFVPIAAGATGSAAPQAPTAYVQSQAGQVIAIINTPAARGSRAAQDRFNRLQSVVRGFMHFETLAQRTLGQHWQARTPAERAEFLALLQQLIETSYAKSLGNAQVSPRDYAVNYTGERIRGERATVEGSVVVKGESHIIELKLQRDGENWIVLDVVTDDVSLAESYAESFDRIIKKDGWAALLSRMRSRLAELRR